MKKAFKKYLLRYPPYTIWEPMTVAQSYVGDVGSLFDGEEDPESANRCKKKREMMLN